MYKLLVVDDEFIIREGLLSYHWNKFGFSIIGSAVNGVEALELIDAQSVDLVITDIRMPVMDGLELCKTIQTKYPLCKIILLTGYKDFEYAQEAIRLGVTDYLLKPVNMRKLDTLLQSIKNELDLANEQENIIATYKKQLDVSLPLAKQNFIKSLLEGITFEKNQLLDLLNLLDLSFPFQYYACFVTKLKIHQELDIVDFDDFIHKIIQNHFNHTYTICLNQKDQCYYELVSLINFERPYSVISTHSFMENTLKNLSFRIKQATGTHAVQFHIGIGNICEKLSHIQKSYKEALQSLDKALFHPEKQLFYFWNDCIPLHTETNEFPYNTEDKLMFALFEESSREVEGYLDAFILEAIHISKKQNSSELYYQTITQVLNMLTRKMTKFGLLDDNFLVQVKKRVKTILESSSIEEVNVLIKVLFLDCHQAIKNSIDVEIIKNKDIISKSITFIRSHYKEKISLKDISDHVYLTPSYFSIQFKKATGMNYIEYLTQYRLKKAQSLLLKGRQLKIYEISQLIGYDDPKYFGELFKKHYGLTPSQYRREGLKRPT